ncbi:MAG: hypothetical protein R6U97_09930 [Desulfosalsimonas sp.]
MTGFKIESGSCLLKYTAAVNIKGEVSPAALLKDRIPPVIIEGKATGRTTLDMVCQVVYCKPDNTDHHPLACIFVQINRTCCTQGHCNHKCSSAQVNRAQDTGQYPALRHGIFRRAG